MSTITRSTHRTAFNKAIEKMLSSMSGGLEIDNDAKRYLTTSLYTLTRNVALRASEVVINDKTPTECIREILPEFLDGEALRCALSNGQSAVLRFASGKEEFIPKKPRPLKPKPITYELSPSIFIPGIKMLKAGVEKLTAPPRIDNGSKHISEILSRVSEYLASEIASNPNKQNMGVIDSADVSNTVSNIFPQSLLEHAIYYGIHRVKEYETGALKYKKKPLQKSKRKTSKVTTKKRKTSISRISPKRAKKEPLKIKTPPKRVRKASLKIKTPTKRARKASLKIKTPTKRARIPSPKIKADKKRPKKASRKIKTPSKKQPDTVDPKKKYSKAALKKSVRTILEKVARDVQKKTPTHPPKKAPDFKSFTLSTLKKNNVKMDSEGVEELNRRLLDLCHSLARECSKTSKSQVSEKTVLAVVENYLPTELARYAISLSHQAIFLAQCDKRVPKSKGGQKKSQETAGETSAQEMTPSVEDTRTEDLSEPDAQEADIEEAPDDTQSETTVSQDLSQDGADDLSQDGADDLSQDAADDLSQDGADDEQQQDD